MASSKLADLTEQTAPAGGGGGGGGGTTVGGAGGKGARGEVLVLYW